MRFLLDTTLIYIYIYHIFFFGCFICQWIYHHQTPYFEIRWNHHCSWVPMFVAFYGYSCPQIYILANVLTGVCSIIIEFQPTYYQRKYVLRNHERVATHEPWPPRIKMIHCIRLLLPFAQIILATPKIVLML